MFYLMEFSIKGVGNFSSSHLPQLAYLKAQFTSKTVNEYHKVII